MPRLRLKLGPYVLYQTILLAAIGGAVALASSGAAGPPTLQLLGASAAVAVALGLFVGLRAGVFGAAALVVIWGALFMHARLTNATSTLADPAIVAWLILLPTAGLAAGQVRRAVGNLAAENAALHDQHRRLIMRDPVTMLDNADRFALKLHEECARATRFDQPLTLLLVQVRFFDEFIKLYGQPEADHLMQSVASGIRRRTRACDLKFRLRSDTFGMLLIQTEQHGPVIANLEAELKYQSLHGQARGITLTLAFGAAVWGPHLSNPEELLHAADEELIHYVQ